MTERLATLLVATYLIGSINFSVLVLKLCSKGDPREWDSQNPGTFNVYRRLGWPWAAPILFLDIARAVGLAAAALSWTVIELVPLAGLILVIANRYPIFHRFKGGKGVAAYLGFSILISPVAAVTSAAIWLVLYRLSGHVVTVHGSDKPPAKSPVKTGAATGPTRSVLAVHDSSDRGGTTVLRDELDDAAWTSAYARERTGQAFIGSLGMILTLALGTVARCGSSAVSVACVAATCLLIIYAHRRNIKETRWAIFSKARKP